MNLLEQFSSDYAQARGRFLAAARTAGAAVESYVHPMRGPEGEELATDTAWLGPPDAAKVLVMSCGTHGVEGFCGSGIQCAWLASGEIEHVPAGGAVLLVHAVNPYGFAWLRRVNEDNVDLNRNWVDFSAPLPVNAGYEALREAICPTEWSAAVQERAQGVLEEYGRVHGPRALQAAVTSGQWSHPQGVFYGGREPTWSRRTVSRILARHLESASDIALLDFHTGLGPYGRCERILPATPGNPSIERASRWFGLGGLYPGSESSSSAAVTGDNLTGASQLLRHARVTAMALEFGVAPLATMLHAVRADCWLHAHGDLDSRPGRAIKQQIRAAFYADEDAWKGMVTGQALAICRQAAQGLSGSS